MVVGSTPTQSPEYKDKMEISNQLTTGFALTFLNSSNSILEIRRFADMLRHRGRIFVRREFVHSSQEWENSVLLILPKKNGGETSVVIPFPWAQDTKPTPEQGIAIAKANYLMERKRDNDA